MKAVKICPITCTVTDVVLEPGVDALFDALDCRVLDRLVIDEKHEFWVDDEALFVEPQPAAFKFGRMRLLGPALLCGRKWNNRVDSALTAADIRLKVKFLGGQQIGRPSATMGQLMNAA